MHYVDGESSRADGWICLSQATRFVQRAGPVERESAERFVNLVDHRAVGHDLTSLAKRSVICDVVALDPLQGRFVIYRSIGRTPEQHELKRLEFHTSVCHGTHLSALLSVFEYEAIVVEDLALEADVVGAHAGGEREAEVGAGEPARQQLELEQRLSEARGSESRGGTARSASRSIGDAGIMLWPKTIVCRWKRPPGGSELETRANRSR